MKVRVYDLNMNGGLCQFRSQCDLAECFPDDPDSMKEAERALYHHNEYVGGGGAAAPFLLVRVEEGPR